MSLLHLLEPEETVGNLWHSLVGDRTIIPRFPEAAVTFAEVETALRIYFHALGGDQSAEIVPAIDRVSHHRLTFRQRIGRRTERLPTALYDGQRLQLPAAYDLLPTRPFNKALYHWAAAFIALADEAQLPPTKTRNAIERDLRRIHRALAITKLVRERFPGLAAIHDRLCAAHLAVRPHRKLPAAEDAIESLIRESLMSPNAITLTDERADAILALPVKVHQPFMPVPLWPDIALSAPGERVERTDNGNDSGQRKAGGDGMMRKAKRHKNDQIKRENPLIVHRFEKILTWTEFMNLHRDVEDDEEDNARKAADDHDEIGVTQHQKKAATLLKIDLDLSPADVDAERISGEHTYPEWDYRKARLQPGHVRVLERVAEETSPGTLWRPGPKTAQRIRTVRRQFEALRPRREVLPRQLDGHELDMDALIRSRVDMAACGEGSDRIYRQSRAVSRDLSVAVLIDVSRSTEGYVQNRPIIDVEKEALTALAEGIAACGDEAAIYAFSSLRRDRVFVARVKDFAEPVSEAVRQRIGALRPGFYTRLGAAIRHVSKRLEDRPMRRRLLLVLTDGKPNDLDHYDGRYGIEDSRMAIREARRAGNAVFGITIDQKAQSYFPRIFGARAFSIVSHPARLTAALPILYRHLIG
ncbi:MAG: VWA domain-containing protein [Hyphomicrobiaceae bacterium]|nr:VWA domain-containing protein [Hyphomicrobiaceae bacterium]